MSESDAPSRGARARPGLRAGWLAVAMAHLVGVPSAGAQVPWTDDRPDGMAPAGVTGDHTDDRGRVTLSYRFLYRSLGGNRLQTEDIPAQAILEVWDVTAVRMPVAIHVPGVTVTPMDGLTLRATLPVVSLEMDHVTAGGGEFTTKSAGVGDLRLGSTLRLYERDRHRANLGMGLSVPTGSITVRDVTAYTSPETTVLPYPMQRGSGTVDIHPALNFIGQGERWSWGVQFRGTVRVHQNSRHYRVGDRATGTLWVARRWSGWLSTSGRVAGRVWENGQGADPTLFAQRSTLPVADERRQGGRSFDLSLGLNLAAPEGFLDGHRLAVEMGFPLRQALEGPQLETDWFLTAAWQYALRLFGDGD